MIDNDDLDDKQSTRTNIALFEFADERKEEYGVCILLIRRERERERDRERERENTQRTEHIES